MGSKGFVFKDIFPPTSFLYDLDEYMCLSYRGLGTGKHPRLLSSGATLPLRGTTLRLSSSTQEYVHNRVAHKR